MELGFIGLGSLGAPLAMNLIESGHKVHVYNRTTSKSTPLVAKGAVASKDIATLAKQCTIVFTIVSDDAALKSISEGEQGLINNLQPGSVHVSMSTILPQTAKDLSEKHTQHQQHYIAAPVFGRPEAAVAKKVNFVLSGEEAIRKQIEPLAKDAGAVAVWDFGDNVTAANTVKLCGNFLIGAALEAIGESSALAKASGVDEQKMWSMLLQTLFNAPIYQNYSSIILQKKFEPAAFTMKLGLKDINLVLAQASATKQQMPLASLLQENMQQLVSAGKDQIDWSAVSTANVKQM